MQNFLIFFCIVCVIGAAALGVTSINSIHAWKNPAEALKSQSSSSSSLYRSSDSYLSADITAAINYSLRLTSYAIIGCGSGIAAILLLIAAVWAAKKVNEATDREIDDSRYEHMKGNVDEIVKLLRV